MLDETQFWDIINKHREEIDDLNGRLSKIERRLTVPIPEPHNKQEVSVIAFLNAYFDFGSYLQLPCQLLSTCVEDYRKRHGLKPDELSLSSIRSVMSWEFHCQNKHNGRYRLWQGLSLKDEYKNRLITVRETTLNQVQ